MPKTTAAAAALNRQIAKTHASFAAPARHTRRLSAAIESRQSHSINPGEIHINR
jgi:hypothetical protein